MSIQDFRTNANEKINKLRTLKNKLLSSGYKSQVAMTIKAADPQSDVDPSEFKKVEKTEKRIVKSEIMQKMIELANFAVRELTSTIIRPTMDYGLYDACLTIVFSVATTFRIHEIQQLTLANLNEIVNLKMVSIKFKHNGNTRSEPHLVNLNSILAQLIKMLKFNRKPYVYYLMTDSNPKNDVRRQRIANNFVIASSISCMRKKMRTLADSYQVTLDKLGWNIFRSLTISVLVSAGAPDLAQQLSNHQSQSTTLGYYNISTNEMVENTYAKMKNEMTKINIKTQKPASSTNK